MKHCQQNITPSAAARVEGRVDCDFSVPLMKRAFLSHRIDFLSHAEAIANHDKYKALLAALDVEVISAAETLDSEIGSTDAEIVEKGLALLKKCDFMIFDCSLENWNYIGCIFEMAYAYQMGKPIIVYTGKTNNNQRPWLRYHATRIAVTQDHLVDAVSDLTRNVT
jgi:nucleoside 2-deoxyribosyltransferase